MRSSLIDATTKGARFAPLLLLLLTGCQGAHLYDRGRDELASGIKDKYAKLDLRKVLATERQNLDAILEHEKKVVGETFDLLRDQKLWSIVNHPTIGDTVTPTLGTLLLAKFDKPAGDNYVAERLDQLGIVAESPEEGQKLIDAAEDALQKINNSAGITAREIRVRLIASAVNNFKTIFKWANPWTCREATSSTVDSALAIAKVEDSLRSRFAKLFEDYQKDCKAIDPTIALDSFPQGSEIASARDAWRLDEELARELGLGRMVIRQEIDQIGREAPTGASETNLLGSLQQHAGKLSTLVAELVTVSERKGGHGKDDAGANLLGVEEELARQRLDSLGVLLKAVHAGSFDGLDEATKLKIAKSPSLGRAAVLGAGLPGVGADVEKLLALVRAPQARSDLLIHLGYLRVRLSYLNKRADQIEKRAQLRREKLAALLDEVRLLNDVRDFVRRDERNPTDLTSTTLDEGLSSSVFDVQHQTRQALLTLEDSIATARRRAAEIDSEIGDSLRREGNLADEYALDAWDVLLQGPIDQLIAYHKAGIHPEEIARFVGGVASLGFLGAISVGVN